MVAAGAGEVVGSRTREASGLRAQTGLERLLSRETNISDLLLVLTELDPHPWIGVSTIGECPTAARESALARLSVEEGRVAGSADLTLAVDSLPLALVEVKLGHVFSEDQRKRYERAAPEGCALILVGLAADEHLVQGHERWEFVSLAGLLARWADSESELASGLAREAAAVVATWDSTLARLFLREESASLSEVTTKFLGRAVSRRVAANLSPTWTSIAGVTSGGGLPIVQSWAHADEGGERYFIAEARWTENPRRGELRFGVDLFGEETRRLRHDAWDLTRRMGSSIRVDELRKSLLAKSPHLDGLLLESGGGLKSPRGDWSEVVERGLSRSGAGGTVKGTRRTYDPGYYGDGTRRFVALSKVDFTRASALDLVELMDQTLGYLVERGSSVYLDEELRTDG